MEPRLSLRISIRLFADDAKCFGPGAADLLDGVDREGSLRKAATGMGMSYSNAWTVLRGCEQALGFPLLARKAGGRTGGFSVLTPRGRALLEGYRRIETRLTGENASLLAELGRLDEVTSDEGTV